ncbi:MAG: 2,3,4,5-tetrahydropyridine-2,6-dicarboxylate N-succinyltransferase [Ignavibacteriae bacterium]|nr:2,3,4,5-tetrahydropyridine-2,6-dicarboxylate N-succinyltransferase [Ignavibacteriota bacterium]
MILQQIIEHLYEQSPEKLDKDDALRAVHQLKVALNGGAVRSADKHTGTWRVNTWVKKGILLAFRLGTLKEFCNDSCYKYFDKDTMALRHFELSDGVRIVPGGSVVRDGAFVAHGVVMMPPSYVNIGAYIDENTMIDSHALIGSCAQIGKRVHVSAAAQIGGVLEPIGSMPVIIEDDVFVGGNCGVYEGALVKRRAVLASGVILTGSSAVYDLVHQTILKKTATEPLTIPEGAVVIMGSRAIEQPFATEHKLSISTPVIIKYRDEKTDAATALETSLR